MWKSSSVKNIVLTVVTFLSSYRNLMCHGFISPTAHPSATTVKNVDFSKTSSSGLVGSENRMRNTELFIWNNKDEGDMEMSDRIKGCIPYMLPLIDGDMFGKYLYQRVPPLGTIDHIFLAPLVESFQKIPFLGLILFLVLSLGTARNYSMSRNLRFNAQQAIMIDIFLILPSILKDGMVDPETGSLIISQSIVEPFYTTVYYTYMAMVIYSVFSNLRGVKPSQIPYLSNWAETATGPF